MKDIEQLQIKFNKSCDNLRPMNVSGSRKMSQRNRVKLCDEEIICLTFEQSLGLVGRESSHERNLREATFLQQFQRIFVKVRALYVWLQTRREGVHEGSGPVL